MKIFNFIIAFLFANINYAQTGWTWTQKAQMPFNVTNNAVASATLNGNKYVFSFGGLDTSKIYSGITQRSFKYNVNSDTWTEISPLPTTLTNIAAAASTVKNKIYILGGYHVYANGNEVSSNEVIIYNPITDNYESNGTSIPIPIDDHVQCVYKDSLIYVITGWSNTSNVPKVQIYNPTLNTWLVGDETPNLNDYKAFGASGTIIGDTIYYFGGAKSIGSFNAVNKLRKGIINPNNPTQITWSLENDGPNNNYRSACVSYGNNVYWIGGSEISYNYNGIAYNGSGGVPALTQIMRYKTDAKSWHEGNGTPYAVMDLRGVGQISPTSWVVCGGMNENQAVTNRTFLIEFDPITGGNVSNNLNTIYIANNELFNVPINAKVKLYNINGKLVENIRFNKINTQVSGVYILVVNSKNGIDKIKIVL